MLPFPLCDGYYKGRGHLVHATEERWTLYDYFAQEPLLMELRFSQKSKHNKVHLPQ